MRSNRKIILAIIVPLALLANSFRVSAQDSTNDIGCLSQFFNRCEKIEAPAKLTLVTKARQVMSLQSFTRKQDASEQSKAGLVDLDGDGKKELVVYAYSGGAHCCDEYFVFRNVAPAKYEFAAQTFSGNVCINDKNEFIFDFIEQYGYFFTCYACSYVDSSESAPNPVHNIVLRYKSGKLVIVPGDKDMRSQIIDNLGKLKEQPYQKLADEADQDNGLRKEFAFNLAVYYFSFGKNLVETQKLFTQYYKYPDAKKVWASFVQILNAVKKDNSL